MNTVNTIFVLQLNESYNIFGFRYALLGTINYKLDSDDGGHFVTHLFPNKDELIRIHETEWKTIKRIPDFDVDTVVIALQKVGQCRFQESLRGSASDTFKLGG